MQGAGCRVQGGGGGMVLDGDGRWVGRVGVGKGLGRGWKGVGKGLGGGWVEDEYRERGADSG